MTGMKTTDIRRTFLEFFRQHGHEIVPSSSLVVSGDPTLLFTNSGMVQFKDVFLGLEQRPYRRATTAQKSLRVSGKHNDLEEVGPSPRHHTFFEMLGNFSFGDYFKRDAIRMAWDLLLNQFNLPVERLWFTVFEGDERVPADEEAIQYWREAGASPERILRFSGKDNFWVMADTGPCGPCSEITVYIGDDLAKMHPRGVNSDDPDYVEIWNLVFMQFERSTMQPLPRPSVDTGMGLERMAMVLQGVNSTYETDAFTPIIERTMELLGTDHRHYEAHFAQYRAVADHARATAFLIADGVLPGNNGRSYVLRRILRRAVYQGRSIGFTQPFFAEVVAQVLDDMSAAYPQLSERRTFILETTDTEEQQFLRTLSGGLARLNALVERLKAEAQTTIPGAEAFRLKDTDGFPLDLTQKIAADYGLQVDVAGFDAALAEQRARSRAAAQFKRTADAEVWGDQELPETSFTGYTSFSETATVLAIMAYGDNVSRAEAGHAVQVALDRTPFYAEAGGQVGDTGYLIGANGRMRVEDTLRPVPGIIVHYGVVEEGTLARGEAVTAQIDTARRRDIQRNHTATHLLHRALRDVIGEHAAQAGSLVAPDRLRFDFTHNRAIAPEQLREIEQRINTWIQSDAPVTWAVTDYQTALASGAIALFGEKYGDRVRVVHAARISADGGYTDAEIAAIATRDSRELCGGTHVARTGEIGLAQIISEGSVGSGIRRIEMLTGREATAWLTGQLDTLQAVASKLGIPAAQAPERLDALLAELKQRQHELDALQGKLMRGELEAVLAHAQPHDGITLLVTQVAAPDVARMREMGDWLRDKLGSTVIVLGSVIDDKPQLLTMITPDLVQQGYHAGNLVRELAQIVGGGGGGRPDMAQAGGRDASQLEAALAQVPILLAAQRR